MAIARSLGLGAVAEGVETRPQLEAMQALGCRVIQGYLFGRPVPATEFASLLRSGWRAPEVAAIPAADVLPAACSDLAAG